MKYSYNNQYPTVLPNRIRLSSGLTRTDVSTFTNDEIADAGYVAAPIAPSYDSSTHKLTWNSGSWNVVALTDQEKADELALNWAEVRQNRQLKFDEVEWRIMRNQSETRLGLTTTDKIENLDKYVQELRDVTKQADPINITWPVLTDE